MRNLYSRRCMVEIDSISILLYARASLQKGAAGESGKL